jgi:hypothetical protein
MSNPNHLKKVFQEWWEAGPIITQNAQQTMDVEQSFYVGCWAMLGMMQRAKQTMSRDDINKFFNDVKAECQARLMPQHIKVTPHINGEMI